MGILKVTDLVGLAAALPPAPTSGGVGLKWVGEYPGEPEPPERAGDTGAGDTALDLFCDWTADSEADPACEGF